MHLGAAGTGSAGWPDGPIAIVDAQPPLEFPFGHAIALAADGGVWVAWAGYSFESDALPGSGDYRVTHLKPSGTAVRGWRTGGIVVAGIEGGLEYKVGFAMRPVAIADDGEGGCFMLRWNFSSDPQPESDYAARLYRFTGQHQQRADWPVDGVPVSGSFDHYAGAELSPAVVALPDGKIAVGTPAFGVEAYEDYTVRILDSMGGELRSVRKSPLDRFKAEITRSGEVLMASSLSVGFGGPYVSTYPRIGARFDPGGPPASAYADGHDEFHTVWYGDAAITTTGDGAAIFVWSQERERFGIFAVRLGRTDIILGAPLTTIKRPPSIRLRFVPGVGVRAHIASMPAGRVELSLHDVTGREAARTSIADAAGGDWVFPGTERLPNGIYFARAVSGGVVLKARVAVVR